MKHLFKRLGRYLLQGLLIFAPIAFTIYIVVTLINWTDRLVANIFHITFPGFGLIFILILLTLLGLLSSLFFIRPLIHFFENLVRRTPLVKIVYTAIKDLLSAFVSDERKFDKPVIAKLTDDGPSRLGFLTDENLSVFGTDELVSVYLPHAYNFSGNLYLLPQRNVQRLKGINSTELMKYIVSGGVTKLKADKLIE